MVFGFGRLRQCVAASACIGGCQLAVGVRTPLTVRWLSVSLILLVGLALPLRASQSTLRDVSKTWSGLDKLGEASQLFRVVLSDSMVGLRRAMQENACDSDVIKRLDGNMVKIFAARQHAGR